MEIVNKTLTNTTVGILASFCDNLIIQNNTCSNNGYIGIKVDFSHQITIQNNTLARNGETGIELWKNDLLDILNNTIQLNGQLGDYHSKASGIDFTFCNNSHIYDNNISKNFGTGVKVLGDSNNRCNNSLIKNNISSNECYGVELEFASNVTLNNNTISNNSFLGIFLSDSPNNTIQYNKLYSNWFSINHWNKISDYFQVKINSNYVDNKKLIYWQNEENKIVPSDTGQIFLINCSNITITGVSIENIKSIWLFDFVSAIRTISCTKINISANKIVNCDTGLYLYLTNDSKITFNTINTLDFGLLLDDSTNNEILNNLFINNSLDISGSYPMAYSQKSVRNNLINGKPLIYWMNINNAQVPKDAGQVILVNCSSIDIIGLNLKEVLYGIELFYCSDLHIRACSISSNYTGISIRSTNDTIIEYCTMDNCYVGISIFYSYNLVITNNLISKSNYSAVYGYLSANVTISYNNFVDNNFYSNCQIEIDSTVGIDIKYDYNYWNDWIEPDNDHNGIVDNPYPLLSTFDDINDWDMHPLTTPIDIHVLFIPVIVFPVGGETLEGKVLIQWDGGSDSLEHVIWYNVFYSEDNGMSWNMIVSNLISNNYVWDTTTVSDGSDYLMRIVIYCTHGLFEEIITENTFEILNNPISSSSEIITSEKGSFPSFVTILLLLTTLVYSKRKKKN